MLLDKLQLVLQIEILLGCVLIPSRKTDNFKDFCFGPTSVPLGNSLSAFWEFYTEEFLSSDMLFPGRLQYTIFLTKRVSPQGNKSRRSKNREIIYFYKTLKMDPGFTSNLELETKFIDHSMNVNIGTSSESEAATVSPFGFASQFQTIHTLSS